jgi:hypothetical protein
MARYPANWPEVSHRIRLRSGGRCECVGECGLHPPLPAPCPNCLAEGRREGCESCGGAGAITVQRRCEERQGEAPRWARGRRVVLTVAHRDHDPGNCGAENLYAACPRCHLRYDAPHHQRNAAATRRAKKRNLELELGGAT